MPQIARTFALTRPQTQGFGAKLMTIPMALFFKGVAKKALLEDLNDIKKAVEQGRFQ